MGAPMSIFDLASRAMSAQSVRMNAAASNLANAGAVAGSEAGAYRPMRPVFATVFDQATGMATTQVTGVYRSSATPVKQHDPGNPLADAQGDVYAAPVDENGEMVEMLDASRDYQNLVQALSTARDLILQTVRMK